MSTHDWYLDELAHAGAEHLDTNYVPTYDDKAATDPTEDLEVLRALGLNTAHTLVDFGAGTGTFALAVAPLCRRYVAVDVSPVMLQHLRQKTAAAGITNIEVVQAGFLSYQHQGDPADFVYSRHALHHLPDFWKAIALLRVAAILKPGGVFYLRDLVYSFEPQETENIIEDWLSHAAPSSDKGWTRAELATHLREEYSPFSWLLEPMIERAGFVIKQVEHSDIYAAYTCVKSR